MTKISKITGRPLDVITLRDLAVQCVIGIHPEEKLRTQALRLDVRMYLDTSPAAYSGILSRTIDYSQTAKELTFILTHSRFRLLESAVEALAVYLLNPLDPSSVAIEAVDIEIHKPEALRGEAFPSVRIYRERVETPFSSSSSLSSRILFQVPEAVIERIFIAPESEYVFEYESGKDVMVMTESSQLTSLGKRLARGTALSLHARDSLILHNGTKDSKYVLVVTFRGRDRDQSSIHSFEDRLH